MKKKLIIVLSVLLAGLQAAGQEKVSLTYKMDKGHVYRYKSEYNVNSVQEMMGNEMKATADVNYLIRFEVDNVKENGNIYLIVSKEEASVHSNAMGRDTTIVQQNEIGKKKGIEISPNGKKVETTVIDSTLADNDMILGNNEFEVLPDGPVATSETWNRTSVDTSNSEGQSLITTVNAVYEMAGKEEKNGHQCFRISYKKTLGITGKINQMGMDMFMEGIGETTGAFWFDNAKGILIADESVMNQDITIAITGQTQMTIPSSQTITVKTHLIE